MPNRSTSVLRAIMRAAVPVGVLAVGLLASGSVAHAEPSSTQLAQQIATRSTELEKIVEQYNRVNEELKDTRAKIGALQVDLGPLEERAKTARASVAQIANTAYRSGHVSGWNALLSGGDGKTMVDRLATLRQLAADQQKHISAAADAAGDQATAKQKLDAELAEEDARAKAILKQRKTIEAEVAKLLAMRKELYGSPTSGGGSYKGKIPNISGKAGIAVKFAYGAIGKPYRWAEDGPSGYDCSGLTLAAWRAAGVSLPHNAASQWRSSRMAHISRSALAPGDLVFYSSLGHVGIYVGGGQVIHAPGTGDHVKLSSVNMMTPYGYGRVVT